MSRDLNKVIIIGRLGRDPEMRFTPSGHPRTKFSVATSRNWTTQEGEHHSETEWFNVVAWDRLAEICDQYLRKGERVYVEGRLQTRRWSDNDGNHHSITELIANEMIILSDGPSQTRLSGSEENAFDDQETSNSYDNPIIDEEIDDEFPF